MYSKIYKNILFPLHEIVIKRRNIIKYRRFLDKSQWWPREKLLEFQWIELQKLLKHAREQVPYWEEIFKDRKIDKVGKITYSDFQKLPIITKAEIRNNKELMRAQNYFARTRKKSTGGSTGVPLEFEYTPNSYDWRVAASNRGYCWAGCEDGIKQAYIWGVPIERVSRLKKIKQNLHHKILRQKYFNCFEFDKNKMTEVLRCLNKYKPEVIIGYTNPLYNFVRFISQKGDIKFRPKAIISAAEKLYDFQREEMEAIFGCQVFNTYGSREFMLIASECEQHKGLHIAVENLFVEIIKEDGTLAKPGEMGEVIVTDLHNYGMPFIRYKIGDMAIATDRMCPCGRELPLLEDVAGRSLDIIKTPDGKFVPGEFFPHLMKEFNEIKQFQVIQEAVDRLNIKIVKQKEFSNYRLNFMKNEILKILGNKILVQFDFVADIPLTKTGKHRVTISKL